MRPRFRAFSRYRPRVLTLGVLFLIAAPVTLANFTSERVYDTTHYRGFKGIYGWPLTWHWHDIVYTPPVPVIVSWGYSPARLAGNAALWLVMLAVPAGGCEWLLRRHRPRMRWSLRTMLAAVAVAASCCAWFAAARNRAKLQDPLIAEPRGYSYVVERPGPKWLQFVVPDNFRRRIVGVNMRMGGKADEAFVIRLGRLPHLKYLILNVEQLTPAMAAALRNSRQLRWLYVDEEEPSRESLAALGELTQLDGLYLYGAELTSDSIACLAGLTNLKTLSLKFSCDEGAFSQMPALPQLQAIQVLFTSVSGADLRGLAVLPGLKALDLKYADFSEDADLGDLASQNSLEELTILGDDVTADWLESLAAVKHLKALHITERYASFDKSEAKATITLDDGEEFCVLERESEGVRRALHKLRQSHPGIVIDSDEDAIDESCGGEPPWNAIRFNTNRNPPWDKIEPSWPWPTWLPSGLDWAPQSVISQIRSEAFFPSGGSKQQDNEVEASE